MNIVIVSLLFSILFVLICTWQKWSGENNIFGNIIMLSVCLLITLIIFVVFLGVAKILSLIL